MWSSSNSVLFFKTKKKGINFDCDLTRCYEADKNEKHKTYKNLHRDGDIYERLYNTERCLEITVQLDRKASNKEVHMFAFNNYAEFLKWKLRSTLKFDNTDIEWVKSIHWQGGETSYLKVMQFNRFQNYLEWSGAHQKLQVHALEIVWRVPEIFSMNTVLTCAEEKNMVLQWLRRYNCVTSHWCGSWEAFDAYNEGVDPHANGWTTPQGVTKIMQAFAKTFQSARWEWKELPDHPGNLDMSIERVIIVVWKSLQATKSEEKENGANINSIS